MIDERLAVWALNEIDGLGPAGFFKIIEKFGNAGAVFECSQDQLASFSPSLAQKISAISDWESIEKRLNSSIPPGALFMTLTDPCYPSKLKNISDPPPFLYYVGNPAVLENPTIAVVGSRQPTDYGRRITAKLVAELAGAGVVIISGLAYGIDGVAHQAALDSGGFTAAVFGCGLDIVYPSSHRTLAKQIAERGCLLTEFPKGTRPERFNFPVRNRIVAGLADGVLVIEAGAKSGALVTASIALDQGRDILAVPGSLDNELSSGPNSLIKQGALAVTSASDIFANFNWHKPSQPAEKTHDLSRLSRDEATIFGLLSVQPVHLDEISRKAGLGPGKTAEALLNLELKGYILRKPGNFVVKS